MTAIDPTLVYPHLTAEDAWNQINDLPVSYLDFARKTFYYNRLYDVITGSNEGNQDDVTINECFRTTLTSKLVEICGETERRLGYNFSTRYHYVDDVFPPGGKVQTDWPGIEAMSVKPEWSDIDGFGPFPITPIADLNANVIDPSGQPIVEMDTAFFENPADAQIRNGTTLNTYKTLSLVGYPKVVAGKWQVPIDKRLSSFDSGEPVYLQHRKYVYLDITPPVLAAGQTYWPVYPDTNQIIPEAKPRKPIAGGKVRLTFYVYTLVNSAFQWETVNLVNGEFWKLMPEISFKKVEEVTVNAQVIWTIGGEQLTLDEHTNPDSSVTIDVTLVPVQNSDGMFHIKFSNRIWHNPWALWESVCGSTQNRPEHVALRYWYKTNPNRIDMTYQSQIPTARQAILHKAAAQAPVIDCGCVLKTGFIYENQRRFDTVRVRPGTGVEFRSSDFADTFGYLQYETLIKELWTFSKSVQI